MRKDRQFWLALALGPLCWVIGYAFRPIPLDIHWPLQSPWLFLLLVGAYPLLEELAFRGGLQAWFYRQPWGQRRCGMFSWANLSTSVLFAIAHGLYHTPIWAAGVFLPSLVFGYFRDRYQSTKPAIVLHIFYNGGYFLLWPPPLVAG